MLAALTGPTLRPEASQAGGCREALLDRQALPCSSLTNCKGFPGKDYKGTGSALVTFTQLTRAQGGAPSHVGGVGKKVTVTQPTPSTRWGTLT